MPMSDYVRNLRTKIGSDLLLVCGATAIVRNEQGEILLHRRSDNGRWWLPGGAIDPGEEPAEAIVREVWEETGVRVIPERIVGVYGGPELFAQYPNGDRMAFISIAFACRPIGGEPRVNDDESLEVRYFSLGALPELEPKIQLRIDHALRGDPRAQFILMPKQGDTR
jgi:8-oxo-dGTP diphosphatase